jgi:hypothetical protein
MMKKTKKIIFFLFTFAILFQNLKGESTYNKMIVSPLNRLTIYFTDLPKEISSYLNSSKTIISVIINDAVSKVNKDSIVGEGIISKAILEKFSNHINIDIYLKSPRGYTITPLEFSNSLMIEVFDWSSLSPAEDNYRMGQLALTNNLAAARKFFELAFSENIANAGFYLGYLYLKANLPDKASQILLKAENLGCNIPDIYSAIAQSYYLLNDKPNFEKYKSKFLQNSNIANFKFINIIPELKDSIFKEVPEIFDENNPKASADTNRTLDTAKKVQPIIISETKSEPNQGKYSLIEKVLIFFFTSILLVTVLLISLYLKWKKEKRILEIKKKFEDELLKQKGMKLPQHFASQVYQKTEEFSKGDSKQDETKKTSDLNPEIKALAEQIIGEKRSEIQKENEEKAQTPPIPKKYPPRVEIALQIQKEQAELIKKKIEKIESVSVSANSEKLEELAKKLGINKTSILAKKNIEAIEKNKEIYKNLYDKFFPRRNE